MDQSFQPMKALDGQFPPDVQEVIDLATSGGLLNSTNPPPAGLKTIDQEELINRYEYPPVGAADGVLNWRDIKLTCGACEFNIEAFVMDQVDRKLSDDLDSTWDSLYEPVGSQIGDLLANRHVQILVNDLEWISACRAVYRKTNPFIENLISLYKLGFYPCGWDGAYPEGEMVVYVGKR